MAQSTVSTEVCSVMLHTFFWRFPMQLSLNEEADLIIALIDEILAEPEEDIDDLD